MQGSREIVAVAAVISIALVLAGCGGSSTNTKASTASTPAASTTPNTSSTPTTSTTPSSSSAGHLSKSARVGSPAFYDFAVQVANTSAPYLSASQATFAAHCIQSRFQAAGFRTEGDVQKATYSQSHGQKVRDILTTCFLKGRYH